MRLRWLACACVLLAPWLVATPASAKPRVPPREAACQKFAKSARSDDVWQALSLLSGAGYESFDALTQQYAEDPVGSSTRIGAWCRSHYRHDAVLRHATFVPPTSDPTMTTAEYDQIFEDMTLAHVQIIVGALGQTGPPCPSSPLADIMGSVPCYWWVGPVPDSYGGVYIRDGRVTNKYGIRI